MAFETRALDEKQGRKSERPDPSGQGNDHMDKWYPKVVRSQTVCYETKGEVISELEERDNKVI